MSKVLLLNEENHGLLDVFYDYDTIINYLIKYQWLSKDIEINFCDDNYNPISDKWGTINEVLGEDWEMQLRKIDIDTFNSLFEGCFYINAQRVYEEE